MACPSFILGLTNFIGHPVFIPVCISPDVASWQDGGRLRSTAPLCHPAIRLDSEDIPWSGYPGHRRSVSGQDDWTRRRHGCSRKQMTFDLWMEAIEGCKIVAITNQILPQGSHFVISNFAMLLNLEVCHCVFS